MSHSSTFIHKPTGPESAPGDFPLNREAIVDPANYSVSFRLQRTTTEYAYVLVPITPDLVKDEGHLDVTKLSQAAIEKGRMTSVVWYPDDQKVALHPIQKLP